jgi:transketolase
VIGLGSPNKAGTHDVHGAPLGDAEIAAARAHMGWSHGPFEIPAEVYAGWDAKAKGRRESKATGTRSSPPTPRPSRRSRRVQAPHGGELPPNWAEHARRPSRRQRQGRNRRHAQGLADRHQRPGPGAARIPRRLGRPDRLQPDQLVRLQAVSGKSAGNYISYGVREFGMAAIMNGMALHGGLLPFGGTFLMFSEYARNALRMAALMKQRVIHVFTHDSIGLGEDGPTHQPVEQTATLRMIPNMDVWRPCDTVETMVAWVAAVEKTHGPTSLCLSRQNLPFVARDAATIANIARGGYVISEAGAASPRR